MFRQKSQRRSFSRNLQLPFCYWNDTIPTRTLKARHNVCCEPSFRYTHNPKCSHEEAFKLISQYLKGTRKKGLILHPIHSDNDNFKINCSVDADFAGMWRYKNTDDPSYVKSQTSVITFLNNCTIIWQSKLQTYIATSTMESEYNSLAMAMRVVLPLQNLTKYIICGLGHSETQLTTLKLANMLPRWTTPRYKHYGIKYHHWFQEKLKQS
jgi:hypothetical protein